MYLLHMDFPKFMLPLFLMFPTFTLFASETMDPILFGDFPKFSINEYIVVCSLILTKTYTNQI